MKDLLSKWRKITVIGSLFLIIVLSSSFTNPGANPNDERKFEVLVRVIMQSLDQGHYLRMNMNDEFSEKVYNLYIKRLDGGKRFLVRKDVEKMEAYRHDIDDQLKSVKFDFFKMSADLLIKRVDEAETYYKEILSEPFDYEKEETLELDPDKRSFQKNRADLKEYWRKYLKYQTISKIYSATKIQEEALEKGDSDVEEKTFEEIEKEARAKVLKTHNDWFDRIRKNEMRDRFSLFMNAVSSVYGPHTGYFPPEDKENFDISMSGRLEGIGATLQSKEGYVKVVRIVPGSPSYKQGDLEADDLILKVGQGKDEAVDVVDMRLDDVVKMIRGKKGTEVRLTVKKLDGSIMEIPIIRDEVIIEETYAKSALLQDSEGKSSYGYVVLPRFYADFNKRGGRSCSEDVRKEIEKLKQENIDGLVLDLRNNGGGSLSDVVRMAGLFIEKGPIVQIKSSYGTPEVLSDKDARVQYDGPLVILVNSYSASASEIMAAAIQDYGRGVIVGSPSTFGKGTVQRFFDLDHMVGDSDYKPLGAIKLTTQKFYRINGGATQLKGVVPDIVLPDFYRYIDSGEKEYEYSMPWDEIPSVDYSAWKSPYDLDKLRTNSRSRVTQSETFSLIEENAKRLKSVRDRTEYPISYAAFASMKKEEEVAAEKYKDILKKELESLTVKPIHETMESIEQDTIQMDRWKEWEEDMRMDVYLEEAISILGDMRSGELSGN